MERSPILTNSQAALMQAELNTGHVLDESGKVATDITQKVYTVYNNSKEAFSAAKKLILNNENIECVIYDKNQRVLHYLSFKIFETK